MPPKKQTKNEKKKAEKKTEDKTFGMKNKNKSAKVQRYIAQVNSQQKHNLDQKESVCAFSVEIENILSIRLTQIINE